MRNLWNGKKIFRNLYNDAIVKVEHQWITHTMCNNDHFPVTTRMVSFFN